MTDTFRALCQELVETLAEHQDRLEDAYHPDHPEADRLDRSFRLLERARAALEAQPEPQGPTDEELLETVAEAVGYEHVPTDEICLALVRAILARWGRPAIKPVPVSERLPGPGDCDAEGRCWWWNPTMDPDCPNWWSFESTEYIETEPYWLPHWALPVPGVEGAASKSK